MEQNKPIITLGTYQLVYCNAQNHSTDQLNAQKDSDTTAFIFEPIVNVGVFFAFIHLIINGLTAISTPIWAMFAVFFVIIFGLVLNFGSFLSAFAIIDTRTPAQPKNSSLHLLYLITLAILCGILLYARYIAKMPTSSKELMVLDMAIVLFAIPYYAHRLKRLLMS